MKSMFRTFLSFTMLAALTITWTGCAKGRRVDVNSEPELKEGVTTLSSYDIRTAAKHFTDSMLKAMPAIHKGSGVPTIAVLPLENATSSYLDTKILTDQMRQDMMKFAGNKIAFVDRESLDAIVQERKAKRAGVLGSSGNKVLLGTDYFLAGAVRNIDKQVGSDRFTYSQISVRLLDAESRQILWEERYEVKKEGRSGFYDR